MTRTNLAAYLSAHSTKSNSSFCPRSQSHLGRPASPPMPIASNSVACPLCTFDPCPPFLDKDGFRLFECEKCNHLFVFPTPPSKTLKALYSAAGDSSQTPPVEAPPAPEERFVRALDL